MSKGSYLLMKCFIFISTHGRSTPQSSEHLVTPRLGFIKLQIFRVISGVEDRKRGNLP